MSAEETGRFDCPEAFCIQAFRPEEMVAHLKWDHGYSEYKAEQCVEQEIEESPTDTDRSDTSIEGSADE